jgi:transposase
MGQTKRIDDTDAMELGATTGPLDRWHVPKGCRIKDFRRIATRYDKLARNFASSLALVAVIIWWAD